MSIAAVIVTAGLVSSCGVQNGEIDMPAVLAATCESFMERRGRLGDSPAVQAFADALERSRQSGRPYSTVTPFVVTCR